MEQPIPEGAPGQPAAEPEALLRRDPQALEAALMSLRPELLRHVTQRLDRTLRRRLDPEDVVQQALFHIVQRAEEWRNSHAYPLRVWVMLLLGQTLDELRRRHLGTQLRDARREQGLGDLSAPHALASRLAASQTSAAGVALREELQASIRQALEALEEPDRRILVLRQFEGLSNEQAATVLGIAGPAASKRYQRALERLRPLLERFKSGPC